MSWRDAPLYVHAHDLARDVLPRLDRWRAAGHGALAEATGAATCTLLTSIAEALTFPEGRPLALDHADRAVVQVRALLRVAADVGVLAPGGLRSVSGRLLPIGKMIGGWRKRVPEHARAPP